MQAFARAREAGLPPSIGHCGHLDHITKRPSDSLLRVSLPFGSDPQLRRQYINFKGLLRVGKLLEELDSFAGRCAYIHCDDGRKDTEAPILVTVSTDRVDLLTYPLPADRDMVLSGMVTYVGASSLVIDIDLTASPIAGESGPTPILQASFTFVARDHENRAVNVPKLDPVTDFEKAMYAAGKRATEDRKSARKASLYKQPPTLAELSMVHDLFMESQGNTRRLPGQAQPVFTHPGCAFMGEHRMSSTVLTMPQDRNLHGRIFGGWLMRQAFEIAWCAGWSATRAQPKFLAMSDVVFLLPVEVGHMLTFDAEVDYAPGPGSKTYGVSVTATMRNPSSHVPELEATAAAGGDGKPRLDGGNSAPEPAAAAASAGNATITNTFHFTFYSDRPASTPRVYPRTYEDAMRYIEGSRRSAYGSELAARRKAHGVGLRFE